MEKDLECMSSIAYNEIFVSFETAFRSLGSFPSRFWNFSIHFYLLTWTHLDVQKTKKAVRADCIRIVFFQVIKTGYELIIIAAEQQVTMTVYFDIM